MKVIIKPWTDRRGFVLPTDELKQVSKTWDAQTWEEYLKTLETKSSGQLLTPKIYNALCDDLTENIFCRSSGASPDEVSSQIKQAMSQLSAKQAKVIELIFWEGKSQRDIAYDLKIHQNAVFNLKQRAIENLRKNLQKIQGVVNSPFMKGECDFENPSVDTLSDQICEVMRAEINRNSDHANHWRTKYGKK